MSVIEDLFTIRDALTTARGRITHQASVREVTHAIARVEHLIDEVPGLVRLLRDSNPLTPLRSGDRMMWKGEDATVRSVQRVHNMVGRDDLKPVYRLRATFDQRDGSVEWYTTGDRPLTKEELIVDPLLGSTKKEEADGTRGHV